MKVIDKNHHHHRIQIALTVAHAKLFTGPIDNLEMYASEQECPSCKGYSLLYVPKQQGHCHSGAHSTSCEEHWWCSSCCRSWVAALLPIHAMANVVHTDDAEELGEEFFDNAIHTAPGESVIDAMRQQLNYAVQQRLRFIDFLADQYGYVNRSAVAGYFGLSSVQASKDFQLYKQLAPDNLQYDVNGKTYRKTESFKRLWP